MSVPHPGPPQYVTGLDLGQAADFSALVVVEWSDREDPEVGGEYLRQFDVRHLRRWPEPAVALARRACAATARRAHRAGAWRGRTRATGGETAADTAGRAVRARG